MVAAELMIGDAICLENGLELIVRKIMGDLLIASNGKDDNDKEGYIVRVCEDESGRTFMSMEGRCKQELFSPNIVGFVKSFLEDKDIHFRYFEKSSSLFLMRYKKESTTVDLYIYIFDDNQICLRIPFPFKVSSSSFAIIAMYVAKYNQSRVYYTLRLNTEGNMYMEYTYPILDSSDCNKTILEKHVLSIVSNAICIYDELEVLCRGTEGISALDRRFYRHLFEESLDSLYGKRTKDEVYGVKALKEALNDPKAALKDRMGKEVALYFKYGEDNKEISELEDFMWEEIDELLNEMIPTPSDRSYEVFDTLNSGKKIKPLDSKNEEPLMILPFTDALQE